MDMISKNEDVDCQDADSKRSLVVVKVGSDDRPASVTDIEDMKKCISELDLDPGIKFFVTHHNVNVEVIHV